MIGKTLKHLLAPTYSNNHRPRILHPTGMSVLAAVFVLFQVWITVASYLPSLPGGYVLGYASSITANEIISLTNAQRAKNGLGALTHNPKLTQAAVAKAAYMFEHDFWAHIAPDGTTPWKFIKDANYSYSVAGENLARDFNDSSGVVNAWMNSPSHKDNVLHQKYKEIGVAVVNGKLGGVETTLVVQMFGTPTAQVAQVPKTTEVLNVEKVEKVEKEEKVKETPTNLVVQKELGVTLNAVREDPHTTLVPPLMLSKAIALAILILLMGVLLYDEYLVQKHRIPRNVGKNWAHLTIFSMALIIVLSLAQGKVL